MNIKVIPNQRQRLLRQQQRTEAYLKKHPFDLLQPSNPMFQKVWGKKQETNKRILDAQASDSKEMWERNKFKSNGDRKRKYFV